MSRNLDCYRYKQGLCDGDRHRRICGCGTIVIGNQCTHGRFDDDELPRCCTEVKLASVYVEESF